MPYQHKNRNRVPKKRPYHNKQKHNSNQTAPKFHQRPKIVHNLPKHQSQQAGEPTHKVSKQFRKKFIKKGRDGRPKIIRRAKDGVQKKGKGFKKKQDRDLDRELRDYWISQKGGDKDQGEGKELAKLKLDSQLDEYWKKREQEEVADKKS